MKAIKAIIVLLFFSIILFRFLSYYNILSLHNDEHEFIRKSIYFDLFINSDFKNSLWQHYDAYDQPKLAEYLYGFSLRLAGHKNISEYFNKIDFNQGWTREQKYSQLWINDKWWVQASLEPQIIISSKTENNRFQPIFQARKMAVILALGVLIIFFLISFNIGGYLFSFLAVFLLFKHPLFRAFCLRAMGDAPLMFFLLLSLFLSFLFLNNFWKKNKTKTYFLSFLIGISIGLATASKLNGAMGLIYFLLISFFIFIDALKYSNNFFVIFEKIFICNLIVVFSFLITFVVVNPFIWKNPVINFIYIFFYRIQIGEGQQYWFPQDSLSSLNLKISSIIKETLLPAGNWHNFKFLNLPFDLILFLIGLSTLTKNIYKGFRKNKWLDKNFLILLWTVVIFTCLSFYLPLNWDHYYLPIIPIIILLESLAINHLIHFIFGKIKMTYMRSI